MICVTVALFATCALAAMSTVDRIERDLSDVVFVNASNAFIDALGVRAEHRQLLARLNLSEESVGGLYVTNGASRKRTLYTNMMEIDWLVRCRGGRAHRPRSARAAAHSATLAISYAIQSPHHKH